MSRPPSPRPLIRHLALAGLAFLGACGRPGPASSGLFVASVSTAEGQFTAGIEGPACDAAGNVLAVNFERQGTIGRVSPDGRGEVFAALPEGSVGNGLRTPRSGAVALEAQQFPNAPNEPRFPSARLDPGKTYDHVVVYELGAL